MLNILHLTDSWGPGGAETVYADLAAGLDPARFRSFAGLPRPEGWPYEELRRRGIEPLIFPSSGSFDLGHVRRLARAVRELEIGVIQAHTFGTSVYASVVGSLTRVPVVCTLHGRVDLGERGRYRAAKWQIIAFARGWVVPVSESLGRELRAAAPAVPPARIRVIYNGVDVDRFHPGTDTARREEIGAAPDELIIGAVGNVRRVKGYEVLLGAVAELVRRGIRVRLAIAGQDGNDVHRELSERSAAMGLNGHVRFLGFRSDVPELYRAFDVYALTSHSEGFPLAVIQALASGLPVVATRCGGPEEMIVEGENGLLAELGSATSVADGLERLLRDPALRLRMRHAARESAVSRFSTQAMLQQYESMYSELAGRS